MTLPARVGGGVRRPVVRAAGGPVPGKETDFIFYINLIAMKKLFYTLLAAAAFAACSDDNYYIDTIHVVDFEEARLGEGGYIWGKPLADAIDDVDWQGNPIQSLYYYGPVYAQGDAVMMTYFNDFGGLYDTWNGFVVSSCTDQKTEGYTNDKSVYAPSGDGGSKQFAVAFYSNFTADDEGIPTINFTGAVRPLSIALANTTYLYLYFKGSVPAPVVDFEAVITGWNSGIKTGEVRVKLAEAASGFVHEGWGTVDLSSLGTVTKLTFATETTDYMAPNYLAIDNLVYEK